MKTKNIFKTLVLAAVLVSACGKNEIADDFKGYSLPVTINVTRQGDDATKATYTDNGNSTGSLAFSAGDKLFVSGHDNNTAGGFKGVLTWVSGGTFSGSINTKNEYTGTADALLTDADDVTATLLPAGYESYAFLSIEDETDGSGWVNMDLSKAFAPTKKAAVEQFSYESAYSYSNGFALSPETAIVSFTISGLTANTEVAVLFKDAYDTGATPVNVTTDASGVATFAVAVNNNDYIDYYTLTVDSIDITLPDKKAEKGHIYNISRSVPSVPDGAISGKFTINSSGDKVYFSQGNLQYQASTSTWRFAEHQYDYVGDASNGNVYVESTKSNNASISETYTGWIDLFGWGTSGKTFASGYGSAYQPWSTSTTNTDYGPIGTYNLTDTYANGDWGVNMGSGWRTLSSAEWGYLFNTRTVNNGQGSGKSYTSGQRVNDVLGVVLYPDDYTGTTYTTGSDWSTFESAGCVFLPAAGYRNGTSVYNVGSLGFFWSSTAFGTTHAYIVTFGSDGVSPLGNGRNRDRGFSVRLVRQAE